MLEATQLIYLLLAGAIGFLAGAWLQYRRMAHFRKLAYADVLGIGNQREFREQLQALFAQLKPANENQFVLCILDLDQFKAMNEQFGYTRADAILEQLIDIVKRYIRRSDMIFRYKQGDEFALVFRDIDFEQAREVGNRLRRIISASPFMIAEQQVSLTVSMGMVSPVAAESMDELLIRADNALMEAKKTKNTLVDLK